MLGVIVVGVLSAAGLLLVCALLAVLTGRVFAVSVNGRSMEPTLRPGQRVLIRRRPGRGLRPGALVLLRGPGTAGGAVPGNGFHDPPGTAPLLIKRVIAVPGDPVPAEFERSTGTPAGSPVPEGKIIIRGDNPRYSVDSLMTGFYGIDTVIGTALRPPAVCRGRLFRAITGGDAESPSRVRSDPPAKT
ncbi:S26 family signal peptidase [Planomonospora sp. ID67723]|uniref:S26 family signal peptidase n=1 Tax=Planomonospora sp. ID67723 TaxID=2738134 RepID=UPI0018C36811|nr:S26 family signal peptidase [Planomonospora sp. ID67723]MBG0829601.1 S26 family signal peptidase [Planomonospora sp. ID67723]